MSTINDLPPGAKLLTNPDGNGGWQGRQSTTERTEYFTWSCPWEQSNAFYAAVIGSPQRFGVGGGATITRPVPLQHPYNPRLYANEFSWRGVGADANVSSSRPFTHIIATLGFSYLGYGVGAPAYPSGDASDPPFIKVTCQTSSRVITDTGVNYTYGSSPAKTVNHDIGVIVGGATYHVELFQVPSIGYFESVALPLRSRVNSTPLVIGARSFAAETVLFESYSYEYSRTLLGADQWTVSLALNVSNLPWNQLIVGGAAYDLTPKPYTTADLSALLI